MKRMMIKLMLFGLMQLIIHPVGADVSSKNHQFLSQYIAGANAHVSVSNALELIIMNQDGVPVVAQFFTPTHANQNYQNIIKRNFTGFNLPHGNYNYVVKSTARIIGKGKMTIF
jgi:hypothetical protein